VLLASLRIRGVLHPRLWPAGALRRASNAEVLRRGECQQSEVSSPRRRRFVKHEPRPVGRDPCGLLEIAAFDEPRGRACAVGRLDVKIAATREDQAPAIGVQTGQLSAPDSKVNRVSVAREMVHRLDLMDAKIDRLFMWMVGLMVSGFFMVIGGLVGVAFR
jgi:hypothetical protein